MVVRLALAGAGLFGQEHLSVIDRIPDVDVVAIADRNQAAAKTAADQHGVLHWGADIQPLLEKHRPDGVIIASPGQTHVPLALGALALGIPVLVEKPMAMTAAEAQTLVEADAQGPGFVLPGHVLRFSSPHRRIVDIIHSGEIGRVLSLYARRHRDDSHAVRYPDIDPIMMTMIHDIDLAVWMTGGSAGDVQALRSPKGAQRSQTLVTARGDHGAIWQLATSWTYPGEAAPDRIEIVGERGGIDFETNAYIRQYGDISRHIDLAEFGPDDSLFNEDSYFVSCLRSGTRPSIVTAQDALAGLKVAAAALASLGKGT